LRPIRNSVKALILRDGSLLANQMTGPDGVWFDLPGGGQEPGETLHEALRRECREEIGVEIQVHGLRFVRDYIAGNHEFAAVSPEVHMVVFMFVCTIVDGAEPHLGPMPDGGPRLDGYVSRQVGVEWMPIDSLEAFPLSPKALRPLVRDIGNHVHPVYLGDVN